jgi:hypothetical protein
MTVDLFDEEEPVSGFMYEDSTTMTTQYSKEKVTFYPSWALKLTCSDCRLLCATTFIISFAKSS